MATGPEATGAHRAGHATADRLDSWKDVAAYLKRDVSTVQRWERREALPIHRHQHDRQGSIYAYRHELDEWQRSRAAGSLPGTVSSASRLQRWSGGFAFGGPARGAGLVALAGVLALAGAVTWFTVRSTGSDAATGRVASLVVLPLVNLSGDPGQDPLAAGLTEELISRLSRLRALRVVSRTTAFTFQDRQIPVREIASTLGVDAVIEGSIRREADRVRISVQLIDGSSDVHLWARDFEQDVGSLLALQADVARAVVEEIRVQVTPEERARLAAVPDVSADAHTEYLLGRYLLWKFIEDDRVKAIAHFERAIELAPGYAAPHAGLAHLWWMRGILGPLPIRDVAEPARAAAEKALALDDRLAEAHAARAYVQGMFDWNWTAAEGTIRRALELEPNNLEAHYVAALLMMAMGRLDESTAQIDEAARLDPLSAQVQSTYGRILYRARRYEDALRRLNRAIELEPRNAGAYGRLGDVYVEMGRHDDALAAFGRARATNGTPGTYSSRVAYAYARKGLVDEARRQTSEPTPDVYVALGDRERAFAGLFEAIERRDDLPLFIRRDPRYDGLHADPRWNDLMRRMKLRVD